MAPPPLPHKRKTTMIGKPTSLLPNQLSMMAVGTKTKTTKTTPASTSHSASPAPSPKSKMTEEKRLKMAYSLYLQQGALAVLTQKLSKMSSQVNRDKIGVPAVKKEVDIFLKIQREFAYRDTWVGMLKSCVNSSKLRDIFILLRNQFMNGKDNKTLEGVKTSLESNFNRIFIEGGCGDEPGLVTRPELTKENVQDAKLKADAELEDLIQRARDYVTSLDDGRGAGNSPPDGSPGPRLSEDNPQFLVHFLQALTELIQEHGSLSSVKKETTEKVVQLVTSTSAMISSMSLAKEKKEEAELRKRLNKKNKTNLVQAFEEAHFGEDQILGEMMNNVNINLDNFFEIEASGLLPSPIRKE